MKLYHNPRCRKSRETLALLEKEGHDPEVVLYLETPPSAEELDGILTMLGMEPRELMRKKEAEYKEVKADNPELSREQLIALMVETPKLIERPILVVNGEAALGRPPENVLTILP